jgi:hypothetical protein
MAVPGVGVHTGFGVAKAAESEPVLLEIEDEG